MALSRPEKAHRYVVLDGVRGIAALSVVALHEQPWLGSWSPGAGYLAVDLFFVLSGFVIAASYQERLRSGALSPLGFLRARIIRLYPLYLLGTLLGIVPALISLLHHHTVLPDDRGAWLAVPTSILALPFPGSATSLIYPLDGAFWSLLFEFITNLVYAFTYRYWTNRALIVAMLAGGLVILIPSSLGANPALWKIAGSWQCFGSDAVRAFYSFPAGVLMWRLSDRLAFRIGQVWTAPLAALLVGLFFIDGRVAICLAVLALFPALVLISSKIETRGPIGWASTQFGLASYAIYAIHVPLISAIGLVTLPVSPLLVGVCFLPCVFVASLIVDRLYDHPIRRFLSRVLGPARRQAAIGQASP